MIIYNEPSSLCETTEGKIIARQIAKMQRCKNAKLRWMQRCKDDAEMQSVIWMVTYFFFLQISFICLVIKSSYIPISLCCVEAVPVMLCEPFMKHQ